MEKIPDKPDVAGDLLRAAREGDIETLKAILQHNKDISNNANDSGQTPLHLASRNQHLDAVKELVLRGANVNALDQRRRSPLHAAMSLEMFMGSENFEVVRFLVDHGADLTLHDDEGFTPVHYASKGGRVQVMQWLMDQHPYGYLPPSYLPRSSPPHTQTPCVSICGRVLRCVVGCVYPVVELVASVVCCLPAWHACGDSQSTVTHRLLNENG
jgi:hypothetical protein